VHNNANHPEDGHAFARHAFRKYVDADTGLISGWHAGRRKRPRPPHTHGDFVVSKLSATQRTAATVAFYPWVVVIEKLQLPRTQLVSLERGTRWQPPTFWADQQRTADRSRPTL